MKAERRWMKWVLDETAKDQPAMPWKRGQRRKPETLRQMPTTKPAPVFAAE